jgi:glycolate oxidase FAD binding subunit
LKALNKDKERSLARELAGVVGDQYVEVNPALRIDRLAPWVMVKPESADEVAGCLALCADHEAAVVPIGGGTWLNSGNPLREANVVLSLQRMSRIIDYSPADLTATVEPGIAIGEFNMVAMRQRQWLPLDPPGSPGATLGAIAACASSGPLRFGFGTPRDYVIGLRLAHSNGSQSKSGGKVVKNVAGYDMNKLYVGSHGTLAVLTALTVKLRPLPERFCTVAVTSNSHAQLSDLAGQILQAPVVPASVILSNAVRTEPPGNKLHPWALLVQFADTEVAVTHQVEIASRLLSPAGDVLEIQPEEAKQVWLDVANVDERRAQAIRISVQPSNVTPVVNDLERWLATDPIIVAADFGTGIIRVAFESTSATAIDAVNNVRAALSSFEASVVYEGRDFDVRSGLDTWGDAGPCGPIMKSIKASFDPGSMFNPGRFVAEI